MTTQLTEDSNGKEVSSADDIIQYLSFFIGKEEYGVDILRVQEIKGWQDVTPIPNSPDYVLGVINLRGTVVPIMDMRVRFGMKTATFDGNTVIIVVRVEHDGGERTVGVVVDAVSQVYDISKNIINPSPGIGSSVDSHYVCGLATMEDKMVILLEIAELINQGMLGDMDNADDDEAPQTVAA